MAPGDPAGTDNPAHYGAIIQAMDQGIGQIMGRVRTLPGQTLVFFLSDNGGDNSHNRPANNGPLRGSKGSVYEGGIRVPAIAWMPGRIPSGAVSREPAHVIDILPTVSAVTGTSLPARKLDGRSLVPAFEGHALAPRRLFWSQGNASAVRDGRWKLVTVGTTTALYDLQSDIGEKYDVAGDHPGIVAPLKAALAAWKAEMKR
jgi:arylsulfatase A-like enzyme